MGGQPSGHGNLVWAQDPGTEQLGQLKRCLEVESVRPDHYRLRLGQEAEIWGEDWGRSLGCEWRTGQEARAWPGVTLFPWQAREEGKLERSRSMVWSWERGVERGEPKGVSQGGPWGKTR